MDLNDTVALVTGANRGLGREFARQLLDRGAARVYAAARDPRTVDLPGVEPVRLDVTDAAAVAALPQQLPDVQLVVNNAGISRMNRVVAGDLDAIRHELETNLFGSLAVIRALAPTLAANGGGAILNVLSAMSWGVFVDAGGYGISKAAAWSMTNHARAELEPQGTQVTGLVLGATDTDMMAGMDVPKNDPAVIVARALDGLAAGEDEVVADAESAAAKAALVGSPALLGV